jgi:hypothetical protein
VDSDAFLRLLNECVLPHLRTQLLNRWEPRDPEPALAFFEVGASSPSHSPAVYRPSKCGHTYTLRKFWQCPSSFSGHRMLAYAKPSSSD